MSNLAIGVDFGGTKIACGLVDTHNGRLIGSTKRKPVYWTIPRMSRRGCDLQLMNC